jgi:hypothetical protein
MKRFLSRALWAALAVRSMAFPAAMWEALEGGIDPELLARATKLLEERASVKGADAATTIFEPVPIVNEQQQYVDVTASSGHEWVAPGPNDLRGAYMIQDITVLSAHAV